MSLGLTNRWSARVGDKVSGTGPLHALGHKTIHLFREGISERTSLYMFMGQPLSGSAEASEQCVATYTIHP